MDRQKRSDGLNPFTGGRRIWVLITLLVLGLVIGIGMLQSVGRTGGIHDELRALHDRHDAIEAFEIRYYELNDAMSRFMLLGNDVVWDDVRSSADQLREAAGHLLDVTVAGGGAHRNHGKLIRDTVNEYLGRLEGLKANRQSSLGIVTGVIGEELQSSHYAFVGALSQAIDTLGLDNARDLDTLVLENQLRKAYQLWLSIIVEFRAHLLLRNQGSLVRLRDFAPVFQSHWRRIMAGIDDYDLGVLDLLQQADRQQGIWLALLPQVVASNKDTDWRTDLIYVDEYLQPLSDDFMDKLARFKMAIVSEQKQASNGMIKNEKTLFWWAVALMVIVTFISITLLFLFNRLLREEEQRRATAEAASRMKTEFLSHMSHELRTPMNAILGFAQLLEADTGEPLSTAQQKQVQEILKGGYHLLELINEVLDLATIESGQFQLEMESLNLTEVIQECLSLISPLAVQRDIRIIDHISRGPVRYLRADHMRLKQVLINLMSNAVKYNRDNGTVTLNCDRAGPDRLRIRVTDTGPGLTAQQQQLLFQPFERLDAYYEVEGTGIGLAVSRHLMDAMGGAVGVDSEPGAGSTFWIELQTADAPGVVAESWGALMQEAPVGGGKVHKLLYVEDNTANLKLVGEMLSTRGDFEFLGADTPELGLELALTRRPDIILLDINLPRMSGYEMLQWLRGRTEMKGVPIVAFSADAMPSDIERGLKAGFDDYLTKPFTFREFFTLIERVMTTHEDSRESLAEEADSTVGFRSADG